MFTTLLHVFLNLEYLQAKQISWQLEKQFPIINLAMCLVCNIYSKSWHIPLVSQGLLWHCWHIVINTILMEQTVPVSHPACLSGYDHWSLCLVGLCTTGDMCIASYFEHKTWGWSLVFLFANWDCVLSLLSSQDKNVCYLSVLHILIPLICRVVYVSTY